MMPIKYDKIQASVTHLIFATVKSQCKIKANDLCKGGITHRESIGRGSGDGGGTDGSRQSRCTTVSFIQDPNLEKK